MNNQPRRPRSFALNSGEHKKPTAKKASKAKARKPRSIEKTIEIEMAPDDAVDQPIATLEQLTPPAPPLDTKSGIGWGSIAIGAFTALFMLGLGLYLDGLIRELFQRNEWLGWAASAVTAIGLAALLALLIREIWSLMRLRTVAKLRARGDKARRLDDLELARAVTTDVCQLFDRRPETAHGRSLLGDHSSEILDGSDLIHLVERDLLAPLDRSARTMVMDAAKRVSIVTAVSPRAIVDVGYVLYENMKLIRKISQHYGGRPGTIGFWRLARRVITHLAATGAIAIGDGLVQQIIGHGIAARLSARLGEGVVNGLLTARVGIAAIDVCRPLAFDAEKRPGVSEFLSELTKSSGFKTAKKDNP